MNDRDALSRRDFTRATLLSAASAAAVPILAGGSLRAAPVKRSFKVGLIGCGGRGNGAIDQHVKAAEVLRENGIEVEVKVVATADWFKDRAERTGQRFGVPAEKCFGGADAYRKLLETDVELVLMATPPTFRPVHYEACIKAGKHVFMEKPVAVDPVGIRRVLAAGKLAEEKGLMVIAGTQRRHEQGYNDTRAAVAEGAIGKILGGRVSWCQGHLGAREAFPEVTPDNLAGSWVNWVEMSGDHIVEQHVHNIDVMNWFMGSLPIAATGFGGRARRPAGNQYDFFSVDYEFGDGVRIHSTCRQIDGCANWVGEHLVGEKGTTRCGGGLTPKEPTWVTPIPKLGGGHQQEHINMLWLFAHEKIMNETVNVATSTATAILGREASYRGQRLTWEEMLEDSSKNPDLYNLTLSPAPEDFEKNAAEMPEQGVVAIPGNKAGQGPERPRRRRRERA